MNIKLLQTAFLGLFSLLTPFIAMAGLTNADVIKMVNAGLSSDIIVTTIRSSSGNTFDTGVDSLIALKTAKVPDAVISVIVGGPAAAPKVDGEKPGLAKDQQIGPEEIILVDNGAEVHLLYCLSDVRSQARGLGFGGVAIYNVLRGASAERRFKNKSPSFIVAVPKNAQVQSYITLASFAVRKNGNREVMVGGGAVMGVSSVEFGVTKDRVVAVITEKLADQSRAKDGFVLFSVMPKTAMNVGE